MMTSFKHLPADLRPLVRRAVALHTLKFVEYTSEDGTKLDFRTALIELLICFFYLADSNSVSLYALMQLARQRYEEETGK